MIANEDEIKAVFKWSSPVYLKYIGKTTMSWKTIHW